MSEAVCLIKCADKAVTAPTATADRAHAGRLCLGNLVRRKLDALFAEARALRAQKAKHFIALRLKLIGSLNDSEEAAAFPES